jgi:hypothetical protein
MRDGRPAADRPDRHHDGCVESPLVEPSNVGRKRRDRGAVARGQAGPLTSSLNLSFGSRSRSWCVQLGGTSNPARCQHASASQEAFPPRYKAGQSIGRSCEKLQDGSTGPPRDSTRFFCAADGQMLRTASKSQELQLLGTVARTRDSRAATRDSTAAIPARGRLLARPVACRP